MTKSGFNVISDDEVKDIKLLLLWSGLTVNEIARYKNVKQNQVSRIKHGDCYSNIDID